jgi:enoyl-CoA hydratase/carnithine racemase
MVTDTALMVTRSASVAVVEVARGKVNAIDLELLDELEATLEALAQDDDVRGLVLTGSGRVFSAGVDLHRVVEGGEVYVERLIAKLARALEALFGFPKPTVAAVNGAAVAGGCILACACDRRVMAEGARMGATELVVGVPFPAAALEILRFTCGSRAEDVVYTGSLFDAHEAMTMGMVHEVHPADAVLERATSIAVELAALAPQAYRLAKEQLRRPALERMRADAETLDGDVTREWAAPDTLRSLRAQLDRMSARS